MSRKIVPVSELPQAKRVFTGAVEAIIFASDDPVSASKIKEITEIFEEAEIRGIVEYLNETYERNGRSFRIREVANGYQMFTLPEFEPFIRKLYLEKQRSRLTQKALETLAIIAYKQPVTKHEIEEIRGVNPDGVIKTLLAKNLISLAGRAAAPGSPFLYRTTKTFLEYFGLKDLSDLPRINEIEELLAADEDLAEQTRVLKEVSPELLGFKENHNHDDEEDSPNSSA